MTHSYIAYIDESGDDGIGKFRSLGNPGQSHWLVISCCVAHYINDLEFVKWRDEIAALMPEKKRRNIHFRELTHSQKVMACQKIATFPLRGISVMSNKTTIERGVYTNKNQLYHYITRYLIERLSWLCRDMRPLVPEGDGRVKICFSRRGGMDYDDFQKYLNTLKRNALGTDIRIHWPVIDIESVEAIDHSKRAGLQIADCIASAFRSAVEPDDYGNYEGRYAKLLQSNTYKRDNKYLSYGIKPIPSLERMALDEGQKEFFRSFGVAI